MMISRVFFTTHAFNMLFAAILCDPTRSGLFAKYIPCLIVYTGFLWHHNRRPCAANCSKHIVFVSVVVAVVCKMGGIHNTLALALTATSLLSFFVKSHDTQVRKPDTGAAKKDSAIVVYAFNTTGPGPTADLILGASFAGIGNSNTTLHEPHVKNTTTTQGVSVPIHHGIYRDEGIPSNVLAKSITQASLAARVYAYIMHETEKAHIVYLCAHNGRRGSSGFLLHLLQTHGYSLPDTVRLLDTIDLCKTPGMQPPDKTKSSYHLCSMSAIARPGTDFDASTALRRMQHTRDVLRECVHRIQSRHCVNDDVRFIAAEQKLTQCVLDPLSEPVSDKLHRMTKTKRT